MTNPTLFIRVPPDVHAALHERAEAAGISVSGVVAKLLCGALGLPAPLAWQPKGPPGSSRRVPKKVRLTAAQIAQLNALARTQGVSWAKIASDAVDQFLENVDGH